MRTMVAVSLIGTQPGHRYDFMSTPAGVAYYRVQTPVTRSRWKRTYFNLSNYTIDVNASILAGPALLETTEEEGALIDAGDSIHPPRNVGLRAERVRKNWKDSTIPITHLDSWLESWRTAVKNNDELWLKSRTSLHGRAHETAAASAGPAALTQPSKAPNPTVTAINPVLTASTLQPVSSLIAAELPSFTYPEIIKGAVTRPNGELYRVRKIGRRSDVAVIRDLREARVNTLLYGPAGVGKTAMLEAAFGTNMMTVVGSEDIELADFVGSYVESATGLWEWIDGPLPICMENGWTLYVDEIATIRPRQLSMLYSVMDGRDSITITVNPKRGVVHAAPGFAIVAAYNPDAPESRMSEALLSRFGFHLEINTDYRMAATHLGVPEWLAGAAENLETRRKSKEIPWSPQMRDLLGWQRNVEVTGDEGIACGALVNSAPATARSTIAEVLTKTRGKAVKPLVIA